MKTNFEYTGGLDAFFRAYQECAIWSSTDDTDGPLDSRYGREDIADEASERMRADCEDFVTAQATLLADWNAGQAGHDFWLRRNHHGAGFWDRGHGANGKALTAAAHAYGECHLYVGDDGMIYCE